MACGIENFDDCGYFLLKDLVSELYSFMETNAGVGCLDTPAESIVNECLLDIFHRRFPIRIPKSFSLYDCPHIWIIEDVLSSKLQCISEVASSMTEIKEDVIALVQE